MFSRGLDGFFAPTTALVVYGAAEALGTYGLLAVFAAGIAFRRHEFDHEINARIHHGAETAGRLLELAVLLLLGSTLTITGLRIPSVAGWLLAPLIILLIRPVLVLAVTDRAFPDLHGRLFLGFFGVRGVAALYYVTIVAGSTDLSHTAASKVVWTTVVQRVATAEIFSGEVRIADEAQEVRVNVLDPLRVRLRTFRCPARADAFVSLRPVCV